MNTQPPVSIIVAMAENRVIGRKGSLPWHLSEDLKRFRKLTTGHAIIMGRKTYDSIGRPLPQRRSIVISRNPEFASEGVEVVSSLDEALDLTANDNEAFVIGGASIYEQAMSVATKLYVTRVHADVEGDIYFPEFNLADWEPIEESPRRTDENSGLIYSFHVYRRRDP